MFYVITVRQDDKIKEILLVSDISGQTPKVEGITYDISSSAEKADAITDLLSKIEEVAVFAKNLKITMTQV